MSVYEALFCPLPALPVHHEWKPKADTHWSSDSTRVKYPPACWVEVPISHYLRTAETKMGAAPVMRYLNEKTQPDMDPLMRMAVEADVVRHGNEQLALPVNHALSAIFGTGKIESYSEAQSQDSRPDKAWQKPRRSLKDKRAFAVFETKIKSTILAHEFRKAMVAPAENLGDKIRAASNNVKKTHFDGKSLKIMAQASKYAHNKTFDTNYVALFDSDYLFLCVFDRTDPHAMKGTLVPCLAPDGKDCRRAFLGWLIEAWEEEQAGRNTSIPSHPGDSGIYDNDNSQGTAPASKSAAAFDRLGGTQPQGTAPASNSAAAFNRLGGTQPQNTAGRPAATRGPSPATTGAAPQVSATTGPGARGLASTDPAPRPSAAARSVAARSTSAAPTGAASTGAATVPSVTTRSAAKNAAAASTGAASTGAATVPSVTTRSAARNATAAASTGSASHTSASKASGSVDTDEKPKNASGTATLAVRKKR